MTQQTEKPCFWCGRSEDAHEADPRPYKALMGFHDYQPAVYEPPIAAPDPAPDGCRCATSEHPGECTCPPENPLTGVHVESPSGQLPPRGTERPAYQTGRAPAQKNPAAERAPGGMSDQPSATAAFGITEFGQRVDINRPGLLRRIWDATRRNT